MTFRSRTPYFVFLLAITALAISQPACSRKKRASQQIVLVASPAPSPQPQAPETGAPAATAGDSAQLSDDALQARYETKSLIEIAREGEPAGIEWKIRQGRVDLKARNEEGLTALMVAARYGHSRAVTALLRAGAEVDAVGTNEVRPDVFNEKFADLLGPFRTIDSRGMTALFWAQRAGHDDVVDALLAGAADPNHRTLTGATPLSEAAKWGHARQIGMLLAKGARVNDPGESDWRPLHWSAARDKVDALRELLKASPEMTATTPDGKSALHLSAASGPRCLPVLLESNTLDINARDRDRQTPLMVAVERVQKRQVRTLIEAGADTSVKIGFLGFRKTALDLANQRLEAERESLAANERDLPQGNHSARRTVITDLEEIVGLLGSARR